jgi:hypothetical protein
MIDFNLLLNIYLLFANWALFLIWNIILFLIKDIYTFILIIFLLRFKIKNVNWIFNLKRNITQNFRMQIIINLISFDFTRAQNTAHF